MCSAFAILCFQNVQEYYTLMFRVIITCKYVAYFYGRFVFKFSLKTYLYDNKKKIASKLSVSTFIFISLCHPQVSSKLCDFHQELETQSLPLRQKKISSTNEMKSKRMALSLIKE